MYFGSSRSTEPRHFPSCVILLYGLARRSSNSVSSSLHQKTALFRTTHILPERTTPKWSKLVITFFRSGQINNFSVSRKHTRHDNAWWSRHRPFVTESFSASRAVEHIQCYFASASPSWFLTDKQFHFTLDFMSLTCPLEKSCRSNDNA